jgi:transcription antitermination protein NusB
MNEKIIKTKGPAKSSRHRARELALQGVYQWRLTGGDELQIEKQLREEKGVGRYDAEFLSTLLRGTVAQYADLEAAFKPHLDRAPGELSPVEFSVLLLGAFELIHHPEIPYRVVINEAVELAKTFGGSDGHKFVNGVLDKLALQVRPAEAAAK